MTPRRRPQGATPEAVARFLARGSDDACCRWLCETAGVRTPTQEQGLGQAVAEMSRGRFTTPHKALLTAEAMARRVS